MTIIENLKRAWAASGEHRLSILAAGVAYYAFLAMVPLLTAAVLGYGLFADAQSVSRDIASLADNLPQSAAALISDQLQSMVATSSGAKGAGLALSLALAIIGARAGAGTLAQSISLALGDDSKRSFVASNLFAIAVIIAALVAAALIAGALSLTAWLTNALPDLSGASRVLSQTVPHVVVGGAFAGGAALFYRKAPPSRSVSWSEALHGGIFAGIATLLLTAAFGFYVANFGSYNATYGALGAVVILLTWLYLMAFAILFGASIVAARASKT